MKPPRARAKQPPAAEPLVQRLRGWANQMWARYGGAPVYLVGSSTHKADPRDIDIIIVLPDDVFTQRFCAPDQFYAETYTPTWGPGRVRWAREVAKLARGLTGWTGVNLDVKIQPESDMERGSHRGKPRVRLDGLEAYDPEET